MDSILKTIFEELGNRVIVLLVTKDGLLVGSYNATNDVNTELLSAEVASIVESYTSVFQHLSYGNVTEADLLSDTNAMFISLVKNGIYLAVVSPQPINIGKVKVVTRKYINELAKEL